MLLMGKVTDLPRHLLTQRGIQPDGLKREPTGLMLLFFIYPIDCELLARGESKVT